MGSFSFLRQKYANEQEVLNYFDQFEEHVRRYYPIYLAESKLKEEADIQPIHSFSEYEVNLLLDNSNLKERPGKYNNKQQRKNVD